MQGVRKNCTFDLEASKATETYFSWFIPKIAFIKINLYTFRRLLKPKMTSEVAASKINVQFFPAYGCKNYHSRSYSIKVMSILNWPMSNKTPCTWKFLSAILWASQLTKKKIKVVQLLMRIFSTRWHSHFVQKSNFVHFLL